MHNHNRFRVYVPLTKNNQQNYTLNDDGTLDIIGIASTTSQDLQKDIMLPSAINSMKKQLLTSNKNLHGDHEYGLFTGLLGSINKVLESDNDTLKIGARILSKYAPDIKEMLDIGVNLGLSIGGAPTEYDRNRDGGWNVKNARLDEISLTSMPANMDTLGTVTTAKGVVEGTCFAGVCNKILKNMETKNMTDNNTQSGAEPEEQYVTKNDLKIAMDELWSEKEQGLVEQLSKSMESTVKSMVHDEITQIQQNNNDEGTGNSENNEGGDGVTKSFSAEEMEERINKSVDDRLHEFEERFFKNLNETRKPESRVDLKNIPPHEETNNVQKNTFSTKETAEILMKKQMMRNPLIDAISQNL